MSHSPTPTLRLLRFPVAVALLVAAVAHVPVTPEHLSEAPYMGVAFVLFTIAVTLLALAVVRGSDLTIYWAVLLLCGAAVVTYAATRLVAFPQLKDDVGNWGETLGVVPIVSEMAAVALAAVVIRRRTVTPLPIA